MKILYYYYYMFFKKIIGVSDPIIDTRIVLSVSCTLISFFILNPLVFFIKKENLDFREEVIAFIVAFLFYFLLIFITEKKIDNMIQPELFNSTKIPLYLSIIFGLLTVVSFFCLI